MQHIVYTSFYTEQMKKQLLPCLVIMPRQKPISRSWGFTYTFLRDNFYLDFFIDIALENGEIHVVRRPGRGRVSGLVARKDTSGVAAEILLNLRNGKIKP